MRIVTAYNYDQIKLKALFDQICDTTNWKNSIRCAVPKQAFEEFNQACIHFTGSGLTPVNPLNTYESGHLVECTSPGYYASVGA